MVERLPERIGSPLVPGRIVRRLFRCQDVYKGRAKRAEMIRILDMPVQRRRIILRQNEHPRNTRIKAIGDGDVHQPVFPGNGYGWFSTAGGQRVKTDAWPST